MICLRSKKVRRVLSAILAVIMVLGMMPLTVLAKNETFLNNFTICPKDSNGKVIVGANIAYEIFVNDISKISNTVEVSSNGGAPIAEMADYAEDISGGETVSISYKVQAENFQDAEGTQTVTEADGNIDVAMVPAVNIATVHVSKTGEGTVSVNQKTDEYVFIEKGTNATVAITPQPNFYIKSVTIGGDAQTIDDASSFETEIAVEDDIDITVEFMETFTIQVIANPNGTVLVNGESFESKVFDANTKYGVSVKANDGYAIEMLKLGEAVITEATGEAEYTVSEQVLSSNTTVYVSFMKVYTIDISYDSDKGIVESDPACVGGKAVVKVDTDVYITATPGEKYRVAKVTITGKEDEVFNSNIHNKNNPYKTQLKADKDYDVEITFAPLLFTITLNNPAHGKISVDVNEVDRDGVVSVQMIPDTDYMISAVTVNGVDKISGVTQIEENKYQLVISGINANQEVNVTFTEVETGKIDDVKWNYSDALRVDGSKYIFKPGTNVVFSNSSSIKVFYSNGSYDGGWSLLDGYTYSVTVNSNKTIKRFDIGKIGNRKKINTNLSIIFDDVKPTLELKPADANVYGYYNDDVLVSVSAADTGNYTGIQSVEYWIECNKVETKRDFIYKYNNGDEIKATISDSVLIDAKENNSDDVVLYVRVTDRAGNIIDKNVALKINSTPPTLEVAMDGTPDTAAVPSYYKTARIATITITDRASCFNEALATGGITIKSAVDFDGNKVAFVPASKIQWTSKGDVHTGILTFDTDANYEWDVEYTNKAGSKNEGKLNETGTDIYKFTVDRDAPTGKIVIESRSWDAIISTLTFGFWKNYSITPQATATDKISGVQKIQYYKADADKLYTQDELDKFTFIDTEYTISNDEACVVYAKFTDKAGNVRYVGTNGVIYDKTSAAVELEADKPNENGFYNKDVNVKIDVNEEIIEGSAFSGIKSISYKVITDKNTKSEKITQQGVLYNFDFVPDSKNPDKGVVTITDWDSAEQKNTTPEKSDGAYPERKQLKKDWTGTLVVDSELNNSDSVTVVVTVTDNAGNSFSKESDVLSINITKPEISVAFDTDDANKIDSSFDGNDRGYFGKERTATVTVTDRASCFDPSAATAGIVIKAIDKEKNTVSLDKTTISEWQTIGDTHTAKIKFADNANYTWSLSYTNKADLDNKEVNTGKSVTPYNFTVDYDNPWGTVTVDENIWSEIASVLTFRFSNIKVTVSSEAEDKTSPVIIDYFKTSDPIIKSKEELDKQKFEKFEGSDLQKNGVSPNEQFVVYIKISDYAGNYVYINTDGYVIDNVVADIILTPEKDNGFYSENDNKNGQYGTYNKDVKIAVNVTDTKPYSGIKTVDYWVEKDGKVSQESSNLFTFDKKKPEQKDLVETWSGEFTVDCKANNSCNTVAFVKVVDNAGNENIKSVKLDIDITAPSVKIIYDNNKDNNGNTYFDAKRTATVVVTERTHHFDANAATNGITITAADVNGQPVANSYSISGWTTKEGATPDQTTHTATIKFEKDANYTFAFEYTDKADNKNTEPDVSGQTAPYKFTVDTTAPEGTVTAKSAEGREETWSAVVENLTFGFWSNKKISISGTSKDATSPVASVEYYMPTAVNATDKTSVLTESALDAVKEWKAFNGFDVTANNQFTVYLKITDMAGNRYYVSTNGLIVDDQHPSEETIAPEITVMPQQPINGIYNGSVKVDINVIDPIVGGTYSGLKEIRYSVFDRESATPNVATQSGQLYMFNNSNPKQSELRQSWTGSIVVDSAKNNSNNIQIVIYATDNAGNYVDNVDKAAKSYTFIQIDTTAPVIDISYDNNSADSGVFFKEKRTATICITERNFDPNDVKVVITNTDGIVPEVIGWVDTQGRFNGDNSTHTAVISYVSDGDYTFDIAYTDLAGNVCQEINYAENTVAPNAFTVDKTRPTVTVHYDNNSVANGKYFNRNRTATVVITEHNFVLNRVKFVQSATLNGKAIEVPKASWSHSGDVHIAKIYYNADGDYKFDVSLVDKAGNESKKADYGTSQAGMDFTVDTRIDKPVIGGVKNGGAYLDTVIPTVSFEDVNYSSYSIMLTRTCLNEINVNVTSKFIRGMVQNAQGAHGSFDTFEKSSDNDGIYTLTVRYSDLAGNEETSTCTFTVNRFGSVYVYDDYLVSLIKDGGQYITAPKGKQAITDDLVITEYNPDRLRDGGVEILITRDGQLIQPKYSTTPGIINENVSVGASGWFEYVYRISKKNFTEDGVYKITVMSDDATGNSSTSVPENTKTAHGERVVDTISFTVDTKAPQIRNIINLEKPIVNAQTLTVKYTIVDVGGIKSVEIFYGDQHQIVSDFDDSNSFNGEFVLKESSGAQKIRIVVTDLAGNVTDTASNDFNTRNLFEFNDAVTVSTNAFVRWYANKALFFGTIGGASALVIAALCFIIVISRKKDDEEEEEAQ